MRPRHLILPLVVLLLAVPAGAIAATVTRTVVRHILTSHVTFRAEPGEANDVTVGALPSGELHFSDAAAPVTAGDGCRQLGPSDAACPPGHVTTVYLEDGDDRLRNAVPASGHGGAGDDVLIGSDIVESLSGDAGDDTIEARGGGDYIWGGDGADTIDGGAGDDRVAGDGTADGIGPAAPHRDVLTGGDGFDVLDYSRHGAPVWVDLSRARSRAGSAGESDTISGFEGAVGGTDRSELIGNAGRNLLELASGGIAVGGRGNDDIGVGLRRISGTVRAVVDAGPGRDVIRAFYSKGARIACGTGFDFVDGVQMGRLARDCDTIAPINFAAIGNRVRPRMRPNPELVRGRAVFRIPCPGNVDVDSDGDVDDEPCRGRILLSDRAGRTVGSRSYVARAYTTPPIAVALDRVARARMARSGGLEVQVDLTIERSGHDHAAGWSVVLRSP
ncbi:MAG: hypothetical protein M3340_12320 [Actinomycetota bacterium]|nr:hypothetical protein [Actinomycetota bacterium]